MIATRQAQAHAFPFRCYFGQIERDKIMKATEEQILQRISEGKTISEIVIEFGYKTDNSIYRIAHKHGIKITVRTETRTCGICGKEFETSEHSNKKYCCIECQRKANRTPKGELDESIAIDALDEWNNVRLAHRRCNSIKWAHIIEDPEAILTSPRPE